MQEFVFPCPSFTVKVTVFVPKLLQVKALGETATWLTVPQLSEPLWKTSEVVMLPEPEAFRFTVLSLQLTDGAVRSETVTVAVQVAVLSWPSFAVSVTVFVPRLLHVNVLGETDSRFTVPQLSEPLWNTEAVVMLPEPEAFRVTATFLQVTDGEEMSLIKTFPVQVAVLPLLS